MPLVRRPQLWYNPSANLVMETGGWTYGSATQGIWTFSPDGQGGALWSLNGSASQKAAQVIPTFGGAYTASATSLYSLGGVAAATASDTRNSDALGGLTIYDFQQDTWTNITSIGWSPSGYAVLSQASVMPNFGQGGLVAFIGGDAPPNQTYQYEAGVALVDMSDITVYDPTGNTWYHQIATGSVPPPRSEFCAVGSASRDNSSYEM